MFENQISRFISVGILNSIVGYSLYYLLLYLNIYYVQALFISHMIAVTHSYLWNKNWTFKSKGNARIEGLKFFSVYGGTFLINLLILVLFVEKLMFNPKIGQVFALVIATMISFLGHKYWSFKSE